MIKIRSLATTLPPYKLSQAESLKFILENSKMRKGTRALYEKVFRNASIRQRRFSMKAPEEVLEENPDKINRRFETEAVRLSGRALKKALKAAGMKPEELDFLAVSTCTGYLCPGLSTRLIEECGLRRDTRCLDVVGMGCGSAIPAMEQAHNFLAAHPQKTAASVSTEICSAALYFGDSADLVVSNAIFADGSAAVILKNSDSKGLASFRSFSNISYPEWKETLRFKIENGRLRNVLSKDVPALVEKSIGTLIGRFLDDSGIPKDRIRHWVFHSGGEKILAAIQNSLALSNDDMALSRRILKQFGNLSSPTILYGLDELLSSRPGPRRGDLALLVAFGAGFSAYACLIEF